MVCREKQGHYATGFKPTRMISLLCNVKRKEIVFLPQRPMVGSLLLELSVSMTIIPVLWYHCNLRPAGLRIRYMLPVS